MMYVDLIVIHAHQQHSKRRKTGQTREGHRRLNLIFIGKCLVQQKIIQPLWCSRQRRLMLASTQGTILILRQHIFGLFLTALEVSIDSTALHIFLGMLQASNRQKQCNFNSEDLPNQFIGVLPIKFIDYCLSQVLIFKFYI